MSREHPRPGAEHARRMREAQEGAQPPGLLAFLLGLVERQIGGPYRVGEHVLFTNVTGPDSEWVSEQAGRLKPQLLLMCKTPGQAGLSLGPYLGGQGVGYDEDDIPF